MPEQIAAPFEFEAKDIASRLAALAPTELDALPFGVVQLDPEGRVIYFSATEAEQSGFLAQRALGRTFFTSVAPCIGTPAFRKRIAKASAEGTLDIQFEQVGDFADPRRVMQVRVLSDTKRGLWVLLRR